MAHLDVLARSVRNERVHGELFVTCGVLTFFPKFGCILCALIPTTTNNVCESYSSVVVRCSHSRSRGERVVEEEHVRILEEKRREVQMAAGRVGRAQNELEEVRDASLQWAGRQAYVSR